MTFENPETWWLIARTALLLFAFVGFAWALLASRREAAMNFLRLSAQESRTQAEIQQLAAQLNEVLEQVRDLAMPSPIVTPRPEPVAAPPVSSITPSGARGYEMAIRMARGGASIEEIVASCGTTRSEARLLRRLHCAGGANAA
jgi:hypothetical protein